MLVINFLSKEQAEIVSKKMKAQGIRCYLLNKSVYTYLRHGSENAMLFADYAAKIENDLYIASHIYPVSSTFVNLTKVNHRGQAISQYSCGWYRWSVKESGTLTLDGDMTDKDVVLSACLQEIDELRKQLLKSQNETEKAKQQCNEQNSFIVELTEQEARKSREITELKNSNLKLKSMIVSAGNMIHKTRSWIKDRRLGEIRRYLENI